MFLCDSLFMEFVVAIGQFYELYCVCVGGGMVVRVLSRNWGRLVWLGCLVLIWLSIGSLFVNMYI